MKNVLLIIVALAISGMSQAQHQDQVTFEADITNRTSDTLFIKENERTIKEFIVDKKGTFKGTFTIKREGLYWISDGVGGMQVYLKKGYDLKLKMDVKNFNETILFLGSGAAENNYLVTWALKGLGVDEEILTTVNHTDADNEIDSKKEAALKRLNSEKLDPDFVVLVIPAIEESCTYLKKAYREKPANDKAYEQALKQLYQTTPPTFTFDNYNGGQSKWEDFKGKYVYIDIWATWCGYCLKELPHLKKLEEEYKGKNVVFVSISEDNPEDVKKWVACNLLQTRKHVFNSIRFLRSAVSQDLLFWIQTEKL
jgi:thiol-disulfide isomerase/thioredoxin